MRKTGRLTDSGSEAVIGLRPAEAAVLRDGAAAAAVGVGVRQQRPTPEIVSLRNTILHVQQTLRSHSQAVGVLKI